MNSLSRKSSQSQGRVVYNISRKSRRADQIYQLGISSNITSLKIHLNKMNSNKMNSDKINSDEMNLKIKGKGKRGKTLRKTNIYAILVVQTVYSLILVQSSNPYSQPVVDDLQGCWDQQSQMNIRIRNAVDKLQQFEFPFKLQVHALPLRRIKIKESQGKKHSGVGSTFGKLLETFICLLPSFTRKK